MKKEIEEASENLIVEFIKSRKGQSISTVVEVITFAATITSNAAKLESIDFFSLPKTEQCEIALYILIDLYNQMVKSNLVPHSVKEQIDQMIAAKDALEDQILAAIAVYNATAQVTNLPSFNKVTKSGLNALKKIKIKF